MKAKWKKLDRQATDQYGTGVPSPSSPHLAQPGSLVDEMSSETSPFNSSIKSSF
jgi:hypothetical protein